MRPPRAGERPSLPFDEADVIYRRTVPSRLEEREGVIAETLAALRAAGCALDPFFDHLSLDEAITNAMLHGNGLDASKSVVVTAFHATELWGVEIVDEGTGWDWQAARKRALEPGDLERSSGRGLALILASGWDATFLEGGRRLVLVRRGAAAGTAPGTP